MSVDLSLGGLSSILPTSVESGGVSSLKANAKVNIVNSGTEVLDKKIAPVAVGFFLHPATGADILVGTVKSTKIGGLAVGASKPVMTKLTFPTTPLTLGDYTLVAKVDTTSVVVESNENNNSIAGAALKVAASGTALFATYRFADTMTFTKTTSNTSEGTLSEEGSFTDANGVTGHYILSVSAPLPVVKSRQIVLDLFRQDQQGNQQYIMQYLSKATLTTLNGRTAHFSGKPNGGFKVTGSPTAAGMSIYFKLT